MGAEMNVADVAGYFLFSCMGVAFLLAIVSAFVDAWNDFRFDRERRASEAASNPRSEGQMPLPPHVRKKQPLIDVQLIPSRRRE